jgi:hypothetical protein
MLDKRAAAKASMFLSEYSLEKGIYMKINYFNADHTHALIDLPTRYSIEEVIKLFKGVSSHWINQKRLIKGRFACDKEVTYQTRCEGRAKRQKPTQSVLFKMGLAIKRPQTGDLQPVFNQLSTNSKSSGDLC